MARVTVLVDGNPVARGKLLGEVFVGRDPECGLCIPDARLSRRHLRIVPTQRGWVAQDLKSRNGTRVAGRPVQQHLLNDGDVLDLGGVAIAYSAPPEETRIDDDLVCDLMRNNDSGVMDAIQDVATELSSDVATELRAEIGAAEVVEAPKPACAPQASPAKPAPTSNNSSARPAPRGRNLWEEVQKASAPKISANPLTKLAAVTKSIPEQTTVRLGKKPIPQWAIACGVGVTVAAGIASWLAMRQPATPQSAEVTAPQQSVARANGVYHWDND
jgi:hypothetical protein